MFEEVLDMSPQWYNLGLQLKVRTGTLDRIYAQFRGDPTDQLRETLKTWLTTSDNPIWRTLTDALRSRSVGATQLARDLETKYCPVEGTDASRGKSLPLTCLKLLHHVGIRCLKRRQGRQSLGIEHRTPTCCQCSATEIE